MPLKPSDGAKAYVKDFKKSKAPQFKGKSDKKKQQMAIAAYLDDKDDQKESTMEEFKPHMMYDPKTGKGYKAEKEADHLRMKKMGYTHDKPKMDESVLYEAPDKTMQRLKMLVNMGMMNKKDMSKITRALSMVQAGKPVGKAESKILFSMLNELIGMITGDEQMFAKAKKAVKEEVEVVNELTAAEKKLINMMYDKKGNLTPLGKKVMDHGKKKEQVEVQESGHTDVASAMTNVKVAMSALTKMSGELAKLSPEDALPSWWTNKVAIAVDKLDGMADYLDTQVEEVELDEAPRRKRAPKIGVDSVALQRAKDADHNAAMGRTKTGRKKPVRTMTSTQRSLASIQRREQLEFIRSRMRDRHGS